jgi:hypothetical protein
MEADMQQRGGAYARRLVTVGACTRGHRRRYSCYRRPTAANLHIEMWLSGSVGFNGGAGLSPGVHRQHAQLATADRLTTHLILMACFSRIHQIRETVFTSRAPPCLWYRRFWTAGDLKIWKLSASLSLDLIYHLKSKYLTHFPWNCPFNKVIK